MLLTVGICMKEVATFMKEVEQSKVFALKNTARGQGFESINSIPRSWNLTLFHFDATQCSNF